MAAVRHLLAHSPRTLTSSSGWDVVCGTPQLARLGTAAMLGTTTRGGVHGRKAEEDGGSYEVPVQGVSSVIAVPSGGLRKGDRVQVFGTGGPLTTDFMGHGSDIMLHFNPRSQQRVVVRNSRFQGRWGSEETGGGFPFLPQGGHWGYEFVVTQCGYNLRVMAPDGRMQAFATYADRTRRAPGKDVRRIDVHLHSSPALRAGHGAVTRVTVLRPSCSGSHTVTSSSALQTTGGHGASVRASVTPTAPRAELNSVTHRSSSCIVVDGKLKSQSYPDK